MEKLEEILKISADDIESNYYSTYRLINNLFKPIRGSETTLEDILNLSEKDILGTKAIGQGSFVYLKNILATVGIPLERDYYSKVRERMDEENRNLRWSYQHAEAGEDLFNEFCTYPPFKMAIETYWSTKNIPFMACLRFFEKFLNDNIIDTAQNKIIHKMNELFPGTRIYDHHTYNRRSKLIEEHSVLEIAQKEGVTRLAIYSYLHAHNLYDKFQRYRISEVPAHFSALGR